MNKVRTGFLFVCFFKFFFVFIRFSFKFIFSRKLFKKKKEIEGRYRIMKAKTKNGFGEDWEEAPILSWTFKYGTL